ncbi:MAG TPA: fibronectin type III domain-containing protein, partial [Phycisphaerae bacterium]|nr:fibronectin type III domain-containing protein [Phycisphaerae bacterium]
EAGGWDILFYSDPDPANWKESNALEIHHASLDYPGEPYRFVRVSGFGKVPNGATGMRFRAWASTWFGPAGPGNFNTRVAVDNAHFAIIQSPNLLVNGNFEQDDVVASFVGWTRPAEYPFPQNGQTPFDIRNVYGPNIDHGTFRPYWGGRRAYGYETYVYGAWIDDAFTFSQVVDVSERPPSPMTFMFYWLQDTAIPDKRAQLRHRGGRIGAVLQYLDENLQVISSEQHTIKWPVAANVINTCKTDQNAGEAYNPRFQLLPPAGTKKIRVNISVAMHLLYSPELSLTAHLVDDFYLGYSQGPDEIMNAAVDSVSHTTATLRWHTSNPGPSVVDYGTTTAYGQTVQLPTPTMMHQVQLAGLIPGAKYYYRIRAGNAVYPAPDDEAIAFFITRSRGDFDLDGDIDQSDFGILQACLSGAGNDQVSEPCRIARIDFDDDVDEADVAEFLACYSGPGGQYRTICP